MRHGLCFRDARIQFDEAKAAGRSKTAMRKVKRELAYAMRRDPTPAEAALKELAWRWLSRLKFKSQVILHGYIPDLYSQRAKLILEADGPVHQSRIAYDAHRDAMMARRGIWTLRFSNQQILNDPESVVEAIRAAVAR